MNQSA